MEAGACCNDGTPRHATPHFRHTRHTPMRGVPHIFLKIPMNADVRKKKNTIDHHHNSQQSQKMSRQAYRRRPFPEARYLSVISFISFLWS
jgi:hypothetical protein